MFNLKLLSNKQRSAVVSCSVHIFPRQIQWLERAYLFNMFMTHTHCQDCQDYGDHWMMIVNCKSPRLREENIGLFYVFFNLVGKTGVTST
jgi:hypothetical protein